MPPDLKDDQRSAVKSQILEEMAGLGAIVEKEDNWGKRDMAFEVKGYHQGFYTLILFKSDASLPNKLKSFLKVNEKVIRYLISKREIRPEPPKIEGLDKKPKTADKPRAKTEPADVNALSAKEEGEEK